METIHEIIRESVSGGFWNFIGYWLMIALFLVIPAKLLTFLINRPLRHWTIRKKGWPPSIVTQMGILRMKLRIKNIICLTPKTRKPWKNF